MAKPSIVRFCSFWSDRPARATYSCLSPCPCCRASGSAPCRQACRLHGYRHRFLPRCRRDDWPVHGSVGCPWRPGPAAAGRRRRVAALAGAAVVAADETVAALAEYRGPLVCAPRESPADWAAHGRLWVDQHQVDPRRDADVRHQDGLALVVASAAPRWADRRVALPDDLNSVDPRRELLGDPRRHVVPAEAAYRRQSAVRESDRRRDSSQPDDHRRADQNLGGR